MMKDIEEAIDILSRYAKELEQGCIADDEDGNEIGIFCEECLKSVNHAGGYYDSFDSTTPVLCDKCGKLLDYYLYDISQELEHFEEWGFTLAEDSTELLKIFDSEYGVGFISPSEKYQSRLEKLAEAICQKRCNSDFVEEILN
jgi:hypothetical protein